MKDSNQTEEELWNNFSSTQSPKKTSVYVHTNKHNEVLYVGISYKPLFRTHQHSKAKDWFEEVENIKIHWFKTREEAQKQERILIKKLAPKYNIQHNQVKVKNPPIKNMAGFNRLKAFRRDMIESIAINKNPHRHFLLINQAEKDAGLHRKWFHPYAQKNNTENPEISHVNALKVVEHALVSGGFDLALETLIITCSAGNIHDCKNYACEHFEWQDKRAAS